MYSYPEGRSNSQHSQADSCTPPIYHTIHDEKPVEEQLYAQVPSSPSQITASLSQETTGPIYQDVIELSTNAGTIATSTVVKISTVV